jgi:hypothetical protein
MMFNKKVTPLGELATNIAVEEPFDVIAFVTKDVEPIDHLPLTESIPEIIAEPSDQIDELTPATETDDLNIPAEASESREEDGNIGRTAAFTVPAVIAAGALGSMISSTDTSHEDGAPIAAEDSQVIYHQTAENDDLPIIQVETTKPTTIIVAGPFREDVKPQHTLREVWTPDQFPTRSTPFPTSPPKAVRLSPGQESMRPPTSYSWLGRLFQPIDPAIVDAQTTGWMVLPEENVADAPPQRKMSTRLRKKLFSRENVEGSEQVSLAVVSLSDRQGREMWNYVMDAILWNWMGKVLGWFRRGKAKNI